MFEFACSNCGKIQRGSKRDAGWSVECVHCGERIDIPAPPRSALGTMPTKLVVVLVIGTLAAVVFPVLMRVREAARRNTCQNNMKHIGLALRTFALQSIDECWPALSPEPGRLMFTNQHSLYKTPVYPDCLTDGHVLTCPSDAGATLDEPLTEPNVFLDDESYFYLGYLITNDDEMEVFADAYRKAIREGEGFEADLPAPPGRGSAGKDRFMHLCGGIELFLRTELLGGVAHSKAYQGMIPVLFERVANHKPAGGNVLFMDGHVEFIHYPGDWPMTEKTVRILEELDALGGDTPDST